MWSVNAGRPIVCSRSNAALIAVEDETQPLCALCSKERERAREREKVENSWRQPYKGIQSVFTLAAYGSAVVVQFYSMVLVL